MSFKSSVMRGGVRGCCLSTLASGSESTVDAVDEYESYDSYESQSESELSTICTRFAGAGVGPCRHGSDEGFAGAPIVAT